MVQILIYSNQRPYNFIDIKAFVTVPFKKDSKWIERHFLCLSATFLCCLRRGWTLCSFQKFLAVEISTELEKYWTPCGNGNKKVNKAFIISTYMFIYNIILHLQMWYRAQDRDLEFAANRVQSLVFLKRQNKIRGQWNYALDTLFDGWNLRREASSWLSGVKLSSWLCFQYRYSFTVNEWLYSILRINTITYIKMKI
jgi:hypothetical protein